MNVELELSGLSCTGCVNVIKAVLERTGAKFIKNDIDRTEMEVESNIEKFVRVVEEAGYKAGIVTVQDQ